MISETFDISSVGILVPPQIPQFMFTGQQIQSLCTLGRRLRDIIEDRNTEMHEETLKSLESLREIPVALCGLNHPMKRQLWRLLDLCDGGGLGFTIELFFITLRQLSSASLSDELKKDFFTGTFKVITANWEKSKDSAGTQGILLDLLCDLVFRGRGVFSDFSYPSYIVDMLLDLVGKMVKGHGGNRPYINDIIRELEDDNLRNRMDKHLREEAMTAIGQSSKDPNFAHPDIVLPQGLGHGGKHPHTSDIIRELEDSDLMNRMDKHLREKAMSAIGQSFKDPNFALPDIVLPQSLGHGGKHPHTNDIIQELKDDNLMNRMDKQLREEAMSAIGQSSEDSNVAHPGIFPPQGLGERFFCG